jgi:hypothetical protein
MGGPRNDLAIGEAMTDDGTEGVGILVVIAIVVIMVLNGLSQWLSGNGFNPTYHSDASQAQPLPDPFP